MSHDGSSRPRLPRRPHESFVVGSLLLGSCLAARSAAGQSLPRPSLSVEEYAGSLSPSTLVVRKRAPLAVSLSRHRVSPFVPVVDHDPRPAQTDGKIVGLVAGGIGIGGLGLGATMGLLAAHKNVPDKQCADTLNICSRDGKNATSNGASLEAVSAIGWIVGALGIGTGTYFLATSERPKKMGVETAVGPDFYWGGAGLHVSRRW